MVVLVLDGHVADRLVGRGLDVRAGDLRLLGGGRKKRKDLVGLVYWNRLA